jgi:glycosyltransferase involved in cell wall biosynthesis
MRVVVISHTYVLAANRGKLESLRSIPGLEILLVVPTRWTNRDLRQVFLAEQIGESRFPIRALAAVSFGFGSLLTYSPTGLWRTLREFRPDIVHVEEEPWGVGALETALICRWLRVPFVFFTWENTDRRLPLLLRLVRRLVFATARAAVAGNREAGVLLQGAGFRGAVSVLPQLGVDAQRFAVRQDADSHDVPIIGFVGRLVAGKGITVLLDSVARIDHPFQVMVVGNGPLKAEVISRARALGLDGKLVLHDTVRHHEIPQYLRRMSLLVLPSRTTATWKEQFGHVLIEAMACGIPVVGSDSGAIPEVIGDAGIVVREGDVAALARTISQLLADPARRRDLAARGRARVLLQYTNQSIAQRLVTVWDQVLTSGGAR